MDTEAWCPVCDCLIEPKRRTVPVFPPQARTPAPPPSPESSPSKKDSANSKRKAATRTRGGLVQGTGRMKPNGTIKRADSTKSQPSPPTPAKPIRYRTIIDQGPLPLYCSEECRRLDDKSSSGSVGTESSGSSSITSESSIATASSAAYEQGDTPQTVDEVQQYASPSVAVLAKLYKFPPPPPPAPISFEDAHEPEPCRAPIGDNGLIMAGRYLRQFCSEPAKPQTTRHCAPAQPPKTIPGWNDGSHAWRSCLYNLTSPTPTPQIKKKRVVRSQLGDASMPLRNTSSSTVDENAEMIAKFSESISRRPNTLPSSPDATVTRRERSLLAPGAEGKLLVPNVKLTVRTGSSSSVSGRTCTPLSTASESGDDGSSSNRDGPKSPLSPPKRPVPETRSWSYDNLKTYDLMPFPSKKEKRTQITIVDGKEVRSEYEVEVQQPLKRLFLFPAPVRNSP